jgi:glutamyl-tRNA synthetase
LKVPHDRDVLFQDLLRGEIITHANLLDDQVLLKSDGFPTYHLAVVVDDHAMKISHIIRGEEWISSTPKHVLLYEAFGWQPPVFAHIPVFLNPDGKGKMSKRKGDVSAQSFLDKGYLPQALLNFLMILGWAPKDQREILSLDEYVNEFALEDLSVKSVAFDINKLNWLNGLYLRQLNTAQLLKLLQPFIPADFSIDRVKQLLPLIHERLVTLADVEPLLAYFFRPIVLTQEQLLIKNGEPTLVAEQLNITHDLLSKIENWQVENLESALRSLVGEYGWKPKQFFMMLRVALTGQTATPPLFDTMVGLSKQTTLERLEEALHLLEK